MSGVNGWDPKFVTESQTLPNVSVENRILHACIVSRWGECWEDDSESQILPNVSIDDRILHTLCPGSKVGDDYTKCTRGGGGKEEVSVA